MVEVVTIDEMARAGKALKRSSDLRVKSQAERDFVDLFSVRVEDGLPGFHSSLVAIVPRPGSTNVMDFCMRSTGIWAAAISRSNWVIALRMRGARVLLGGTSTLPQAGAQAGPTARRRKEDDKQRRLAAPCCWASPRPKG